MPNANRSSVNAHQQALDNAGQQAGVISRSQLLFLGWSDEMVRSQVKAKRWQRLFPGVYLTNNGEPTMPSWWWAAHLSGGPRSAIAGAAALQVWGIEKPALPVTIEIPHSQRKKPLAGCSDTLVTQRRGFDRPTRQKAGLPPTVALPFAVIDVCDTLVEHHAIADVVTQACRTHLASPEKIRRALEAYAKLGNRNVITAVLDEVEGGAESVLELDAVTDVLRAHGLPEGRGQVRDHIRGANVRYDRVLEEWGVVLEFDGQIGHSGYSGRRRDHHRDNEIAAKGGVCMRFGWSAVHEWPCESAAQIAAVLWQRGWTDSPTPCGPKCRLFNT